MILLVALVYGFAVHRRRPRPLVAKLNSSLYLTTFGRLGAQDLTSATGQVFSFNNLR